MKFLASSFIGIGLSFAGITSTFAAPPAPKPNIVLVLADDLGWMDTGVYGSSFYHTPNIDALAKRGMLFTNAYAAAPLCSASRASIMSGQYPARTGLTGAGGHLPKVRLKAIAPSRGNNPAYRSVSIQETTRLDTKIYTIAEALKDAGYVSGHFGKWHIGPEPYSPLQQGFDVDVPHYPGPGPAGSYVAPWKFPTALHFTGKPGEHIEDRMAQEAVEFIRAHRNEPFYLNYWAFSVHAPFDAKSELIEKYRQLADPNKPQHQPLMAAMIESLDDAVGTLVDELEKQGLLDQTVFIFTSDNGGNMYDRIDGEPPTNNAPLRGGKATIFEGGTKVPFIVDWPGVVQPGTRSDALVTGTDLYPTLIQIGGGSLHADQPLDGVSLVPILAGDARSVRDYIFCHFPHNTPATGNLASTYLRKGRWVLIRIYRDGADGADRFELYNLADDPSESADVAAMHPEVVAAMREQMEKLCKETGAAIPKRNPDFDPAEKPKNPVMPPPEPGVPAPFSGIQPPA